MSAVLTIDVYVDLICPWCLIGKRYLDEALVRMHCSAPEAEVTVRWHSVQLLPDAPAVGWNFDAFYLRRLGSVEAMHERQAQVNRAAAKAGFQIDFTRIPRMPNTLQAHQLLSFASTIMAADAFAILLEQLFDTHFCGDGDLGDLDTLSRIAADHGLNVTDVLAWIESGRGHPKKFDVPRVPFFVFNQQRVLSGAQAAELLLDAMLQACALDPIEQVP